MAETPSALKNHGQAEHTLYEEAGEVLFPDREDLEREFADTKLLQDISSALIQEENIDALYEKFMDAAAIIMHAPFASMQVLHTAPGGDELQLLCHRGFSEEAARFWERSGRDSGSACGAALRAGTRVIVTDVRCCDFMTDTEDLQVLQRTGIRAAQATPLISRAGKLIGMLSTHWREPHRSSERELRLLDILARQASDLIERRKAEESLSRQRRLYEAILNNTPDLAYVFDLDHRFIYVNEGLLKMWGKTREDAIGRNCLELGYETWHAELHDREIDQVIRTRQPVRGQVPFTGTFGRRIYDYILVPVLDAEARVEAVAGTTRDVTDLRSAEEALRSHGEKVRALVNAAPLGIYLVDEDFCISEANPIALATFGEAGGSAGVIGQPFDEIIQRLWPAAYAEEVIRIFRHTLQTGESFETPERVEQRLDRGVTEYYEWRVDRIPLPGGRRGVVCYFRDISPQVMAKQALIESEQRFRTLADNITQIAWTARADGEIFWYNRRWQDYTGLTVDQVTEAGAGSVVHPDHLDHVVESYFSRVKQGEPWEDTFPLRGRDGNYRWFLSRAVPIRDEDGTILRWFGTNTDITAQMQASEALRDADRKKDEFLAMLSHELRNPIAPIFNAVQLLAQEPENPVQRDARRVINREIRHLSRLVNDLLEVSRITTGMIKLRREPLLLKDVVERAVERLRSQVQRKNQTVHVAIEDDGAMLDGDATRLEQVFGNLLHNASKYNDTGGHIWISTAREARQAVIRVRDSGTGIAPGILPKIFEMFTQADTSLDRTDSGLGIGLALVKSLVEQHGGEIEARSDGIGRGSEFCVRLPLGCALQGQIEIPVPPPAEMKPLRILVVDDHVNTARMLAMVLKSWGHQLKVAHDGKEALEKLAGFAADLVLMDIGMPDMDGYEVARRIRGLGGDSTPRLVAITGYGHEVDMQRSREAGFDLHLVKPVEPAQLRELLMTSRDPGESGHTYLQ